MTDHTHTAQNLEDLHRDAEGTSYHLHHVHEAGDWRQFDRLSREALTERHDDLHGLPLAAHAELGGSTVAWYTHMRNMHLTEPVRGSLELVKAQHATLHPNPGHLGERHRPVLPGTAILENATLALREGEMPRITGADQLAVRGTVTGRFLSDHPFHEEIRRGKLAGGRQARMDQLLAYAESCAETARTGEGFWRNSIDAYQQLGELLRDGYPLPAKWRSRD